MKTSDKLLLVAGGIAAGLALGLLFAPHKGKKTRRILREEGHKIAGKMKEEFEKGREKIDELKKEVNDVVDNVISHITKESNS
jgi:gas vesicle protein